MIIRPATIHDAEQIALVHIESRKAVYQKHALKDVLDDLSQEKRTAEWREYLSQGTKAWVVEKGDNLFGFISICPARDADKNPNEVIEISAIYLLPELWGKGFGKQLCEVVFDYAIQNCFKEVVLWVLEENKQARQFYEGLGFRLTGDVKTEHIGCEKLSVIRYQKNDALK